MLSTQFALLTSRHFIPVCSTFLACQQVRDVQPEASLYTFPLATAKIPWAGSLLASGRLKFHQHRSNALWMKVLDDRLLL